MNTEAIKVKLEKARCSLVMIEGFKRKIKSVSGWVDEMCKPGEKQERIAFLLQCKLRLVNRYNSIRLEIFRAGLYEGVNI